jgi:hypothetical protein
VQRHPPRSTTAVQDSVELPFRHALRSPLFQLEETPRPRKRKSSARAWQRRGRCHCAARLRGLGAGRSRTQLGCGTSDAGSCLLGSIRSNSPSADCCNS